MIKIIKQEESNLKTTLNIIQEQIENMDKSVISRKKQILESIDLLSLLDAELKQVENNDNVIRKNLVEIEVTKSVVYNSMLFSPYFARIDFKYMSDKLESFYIGKATVHDNDYRVIVYDWRTPIASLYYNYGYGNASYTANDNEFNGEIVLRRQFDIKNSKIINMFDMDIHINDDILKSVLNESYYDVELKPIIRTIQENQNEVIRCNADNLYIQGCAGSGKTSVILHRIAYLLYNDRENLKNNNIFVISPNKIYKNYISNILPELGECQVFQNTFDELLSKYIPEFKIYPSYKLHDTEDKETQYYKFSKNLIYVIDKYIKQLSNIRYEFKYNKNFKITQMDIEKHINLFNLHKFKISKQYQCIKSHIINELNENVFDDKTRKLEIARVEKLFSFDVVERYYKIFDIEWVRNNVDELEEKSMLVYNFKHIRNGEMYFEDTIPYLYFKNQTIDLYEIDEIKLVVIDEIQNYTTTQIQFIQDIFPNAKFILSGDKNQVTVPNTNNKNIPIEKNVFQKCEYRKFIKNIRSSFEINEFCNNILDIKNESLDREYLPVKLKHINKEEFASKLLSHLRKLFTSDFKIAVICKNINELNSIQNELSKCYGYKKYRKFLGYFTETSKKFYKKINFMPVSILNGVEFEHVIILDLNSYEYSDKNLLYVACTRALHILEVLYTSESTDFDFLLK